MLSKPDKLRANSFLNALAGNTTLVDAQHRPNSHLFVVGDFDLSHQSYFETFAKSKECTLSSFNSSTELLEVLYQSPQIPYLLGVIACLVKNEDDVSDSVSLLKFLNTVHTDEIIGTVFFGEISNVDSVLYLSQQSDGYKPLSPSSEKGVEKFLSLALDASLRRQKKLLENLSLVVKAGTLSPKEVHVMLKVISGLTNKEIANELDNSSRTIEIHRASIFEKLNVKNAIELSKLIHGVIRS